MRTKMFMTTKQSEYTDNVFRGPWDVFHTPNMNYMIDTHKYGEPVRTDTITSTVTSPPVEPGIWSVGTYRGISRRLAPQTIEGLFNLGMFTTQFGSSDSYTRVYAYVLDTTTSPGIFFAALLIWEDGTAAWGSGAGIDPFLKPVFWEVSPPLTPVTIPDNGREYRLVIEVGAVTGSMIAPTLILRQQMGVRKADLTPLDDLMTVGGASYFDFFTDDIILKDFILPPNHEVELATLITSLPTTITATSYRTHPLWYKCFIPFDRVIASLACSTSGRAKVSLYLEEVFTNEPPVKFLIESEWNGAIEHPTRELLNLYFKTQTETDTGFPFDLKIGIFNPLEEAQSEDMLLTGTDDQPNMYEPSIIGLYPSLLIKSTDGTLRTMTGKFISSKLAVAIYAGRFGIVSEVMKELVVYGKAPFFHALARVATGLSLGIGAIGTDFISFFILGRDPRVSLGENRTIYRFDYNGSQYAGMYQLPVTDASGIMGIDRGSSVLYYGRNIPDGKVYPHVLATNTTGAAFPSPGASWTPIQVIVMADNSICALFSFFSTGSTQNLIYHYAPNGTVLHIVTMTTIGNAVVKYMSHSATDDPDLVWIRFYNQVLPLTDRFVQYKLSLGSIVREFGGDQFLFNNGKGPADQPCSHLIYGGQINGAMVPMMITPDVSGMYFFNANGRFDSHYHAIDIKIPDPTIRTALIGE